MAIAVNLFRDGAVGFIDWLGRNENREDVKVVEILPLSRMRDVSRPD
jgi:hypothetical protein